MIVSETEMRIDSSVGKMCFVVAETLITEVQRKICIKHQVKQSNEFMYKAILKSHLAAKADVCTKTSVESSE